MPSPDSIQGVCPLPCVDDTGYMQRVNDLRRCRWKLLSSHIRELSCPFNVGISYVVTDKNPAIGQCLVCLVHILQGIDDLSSFDTHAVSQVINTSLRLLGKVIHERVQVRWRVPEVGKLCFQFHVVHVTILGEISHQANSAVLQDAAALCFR
ncbi:hypothetical protein D3C85_1239040 [compost metagenome]